MALIPAPDWLISTGDGRTCFSPRAGIRGFDTGDLVPCAMPPEYRVSVPERGFVALIRVQRLARLTATGSQVSVPERGFVALIRFGLTGSDLE